MNKRRKDTLFTLCLHFQINFLQEITFFAPGETFIFRDNIMLSANLFSFNGKSLLNLGLRLMKQVLCPCDEFYEKEIQKALIFKIPRCILHGILLISVGFLADAVVIYCKAVVIHYCKATTYVVFY